MPKCCARIHRSHLRARALHSACFGAVRKWTARAAVTVSHVTPPAGSASDGTVESSVSAAAGDGGPPSAPARSSGGAAGRGPGCARGVPVADIRASRSIARGLGAPYGVVPGAVSPWVRACGGRYVHTGSEIILPSSQGTTLERVATDGHVGTVPAAAVEVSMGSGNVTIASDAALGNLATSVPAVRVLAVHAFLLWC